MSSTAGAPVTSARVGKNQSECSFDTLETWMESLHAVACHRLGLPPAVGQMQNFGSVAATTFPDAAGVFELP